MSETDGAMVGAALRGDRSAFAELYNRRARWIRALCYHTTGDLHSAADLTQEVFLRAYAKLDSLRKSDRFAAWLTGIAQQVCREWKRGKLRDRQTACSMPEDLQPPAREEQADPRLETLREALMQLPERERLALQAFYLQGLDAEEARSVLGLSQSTFYQKLVREQREPEYFGATVKPGDKQAVLLRWKLDEGGHRVIYGDLSVGNVASTAKGSDTPSSEKK